MKRLLIYTIALAGMAAVGRSAPLEAVADTFVKSGKSFGADESLRTKIKGSRSRVSIFRFDVSSLSDLSSASGIKVTLTVTEMASSSTETLRLYGVVSGSALESFVEGTGTQAAPTTDGLVKGTMAVFESTLTESGGVVTTNHYFYDPDRDTPGEQALARLTVAPDTAAGTIIEVSSAAMLDFARASGNNLLTFVMTREVSTELNENLKWASREHPTYTGPTVDIPEPHAFALIGGLFVLVHAAVGRRQANRCASFV